MDLSPIVLIRHGAYHQPKGVPSALLPHPLTSEGQEHAKAGAKELLDISQKENLSLHPTIFSSTSLRAWETASLIKSVLEKETKTQFEIQTADDLCERSVGPMANLTVEEIESVLEKDPRFEVPASGWKSTPDYRLPYPGAESLMMAGNRVANFIKGTLQKMKTQNELVLFVGHGASFRFASHHLGLWDVETARAHSMFYGKPVPLKWNQEILTQFTPYQDNWKKRLAHDEPKD